MPNINALDLWAERCTACSLHMKDREADRIAVPETPKQLLRLQGRIRAVPIDELACPDVCVRIQVASSLPQRVETIIGPSDDACHQAMIGFRPPATEMLQRNDDWCRVSGHESQGRMVPKPAREHASRMLEVQRHASTLTAPGEMPEVHLFQQLYHAYAWRCVEDD